MTLKGIVCDFGGVLVVANSNEIRRQWADRFDISLEELLNVLFLSDVANDAALGKISEDQMWQAHAEHFRLSNEELRKFRSDVFAEDRINQPLIETVTLLPSTVKKAILSNAWSGSRTAFTEKFHFDRVFDLMVISAEEGLAKPDERIYALTAERLALNPWEILFIDDQFNNVMAATKYGMAAIHFLDTDSTIKQMQTILKSQGVIG